MGDGVKVGSHLVDSQLNVRAQLIVLWMCHFILWIFGDMFSLLQEMGEPTTDAWVQIVAPTTAIVLTLIVAFTLIGSPGHVRLVTLIAAPVYLLFDIGFFIDATEGWEYYIGVFYVLFIVLVLVRSYFWPKGATSHQVRS